MPSRADLLAALVFELRCTLCGGLYENPVSIRGCNCAFCRKCVESTLHGKGIVLSECPTCHKPVAHKELLDNHLLQNLVQIIRPWLSNKSGDVGIGGAHKQGAQKAIHAGPYILPDTEAVPCSSELPIRAKQISVEEGGQPEFDAFSGLCTEAKLRDSSDDQAAQRSTPEPGQGPIQTAILPGPRQSPIAVATREGIIPSSAEADALAEVRTGTAQHFNQPMQWEAARSERCESPADSVQCSPVLAEVCCNDVPGGKATPDATLLVPPDTSIEASVAAREAEAEEVRRQLGELQLIIDDLDAALEVRLAADALSEGQLPEVGASAVVSQPPPASPVGLPLQSQAVSPISLPAGLPDSRSTGLHANPSGSILSPGSGMKVSGVGQPAIAVQKPAICDDNVHCQPRSEVTACTESRHLAGPPRVPLTESHSWSQQLSASVGNSQMQRAFKTVAHYGGTRQQLAQLSGICSRLQYNVSPSGDLNGFTTHLIVPGTQRRTPITAAYLCALLSGVRVLSWDWVAASGQLAGCREGDYEITGDDVTALTNASAKGRRRQRDMLPALCEQLIFLLSPSVKGCYSLSRSDLEAVILAAGGKVVGDSRAAADLLHHRESLYVLVAKSAPEEAVQLAATCKAATVVRPEWLVECVSHMRLLPTARFEFI